MQGDAGDVSLIPWLGRPPGGENGNPLQYSCLRNPMDRGAWWAAVHGVRVRHDLATEPPPPPHIVGPTLTPKLDSKAYTVLLLTRRRYKRLLWNWC